MFRDFKPDTRDFSVPLRDGSKIPLNVIVIDQSLAKQYGVNRFGFVKSDIQLLHDLYLSGDNKRFEAIQKLNNVQTPVGDNSGLSDAEIIANSIPSWVQTPPEFKRYARSLSLPVSSEPLVKASDSKTDGTQVD